MKKCWFLTAFLLVFVTPYVVFSFADGLIESESPLQNEIGNNCSFVVSIGDGVRVREMDLEDYIAAVVAGEMPSSFELEALKAQAVATRTFTLKMINEGWKHIDFDVCTDPACCQAFREVADYSEFQSVLEAVAETKSEVLMYDEELIEATYFSCSGGRTEAAVEVWGTDIPYLQAQDSPGEERATHYTDFYYFTIEEFLTKLNLSGEIHIDSIVRTEGGGVKTVNIGEKTYSGIQMRELLGLRSTVFEIEIIDDGVQITTKGYGHRVGMSQYGAEAMAIDGRPYDEILAYYYPGTERKVLSQHELFAIFDKAGNL